MGVAAYPIARARHSKISPIVWIAAGGAVVVLGVVMAVIALALGPKPPTPCPSPCRIPPSLSPALSAPNLYQSQAYGYSVEYFPEIEHQPVAMTDRTIGWNFFLGGSTAIWPTTFTAEPADGRTAEQVVDAIQGEKFPDATIAFSIPGAGLGYNPGAGNVYDATFRTAQADSVPARLLIVASVRNGLAVYMTAIGPIDSNWGMPHPNPSETRAGNLASALVNGVIFPGDTPK